MIPPPQEGRRKRMTLDPKIAVRFWSYVHKQDDGCWIWTGSRNVGGYGRFRVPNDREYRTHQLAWLLSVKDLYIPTGFDICHKCDVRACCNPAHVYLGTRTDNMQDCARRKRFPCRAGEQNIKAKLTQEQVREIRGTRTPLAVAARTFHVSLSLVSQIRRGKIWRDS